MKPPNPSEKNILTPISEMLTSANTPKMALDVANFLTTAVLVSAATALVQAPASALILNNITRGRVFAGLPFVSTAVAYRLYRGYTASLPGGTARNAYMAANKKNNQAAETPSDLAPNAENISSNNPAQKSKFLLTPVISISLVDTALTQFSELKSQLVRLGTIDTTFNCRTRHNTRALMSAAFVPRLTVNFTNYASFLLLNEHIAQRIRINDLKSKYFLSGAASGAVAALLMLPVTYLRDMITAQITVKNGELILPKVRQILSHFVSMIEQQGIQKLAHENGYRLLELAFLRILRSSLTLAIISGVVSGIGCEPLTPLFQSKKTANDSVPTFFNQGAEPPPVSEKLPPKEPSSSSKHS